MNEIEIMQTLREQATEYDRRGYGGEATERYEIIDLIESLQAQLAAPQRRAQDARNELCLKCGRYRESHNGACNGCRWKE